MIRYWLKKFSFILLSEAVPESVVCGTKRDAETGFRKVAENLEPISPKILSRNPECLC